jgi:RNA polymerase sigma factor (sigma-70 family)
VRLDDPEYANRIAQKLTQIAWFRYRIAVEEAQDVIQNAFVAFLEVRHRYEAVADHPAILIGVFRKKCLEHIDRSVREKRKISRYCSTTDAARENPWIRPKRAGEAPSALEQVVKQEEREHIHGAIEDLKPAARSLISLMSEKDFDRQKVIDELKLNKNTVDSRIHVTRRELRRLLRKREISM